MIVVKFVHLNSPPVELSGGRLKEGLLRLDLKDISEILHLYIENNVSCYVIKPVRMVLLGRKIIGLCFSSNRAI